jgi:hypothetical protein
MPVLCFSRFEKLLPKRKFFALPLALYYAGASYRQMLVY